MQENEAHLKARSVKPGGRPQFRPQYAPFLREIVGYIPKQRLAEEPWMARVASYLLRLADFLEGPQHAIRAEKAKAVKDRWLLRKQDQQASDSSQTTPTPKTSPRSAPKL